MINILGTCSEFSRPETSDKPVKLLIEIFNILWVSPIFLK